MDRAAGSGVGSVTIENESVSCRDIQIPGAVDPQNASMVRFSLKSRKGDIIGIDIQSQSRRSMNEQTDRIGNGVCIALIIQILEIKMIRMNAVINVVQTGISGVDGLLDTGFGRTYRKIFQRLTDA